MIIGRLSRNSGIAAAALVVVAFSSGGCKPGTREARGEQPARLVEPGQAEPPPGLGITAEQDAEILHGPPGTVVVSHRSAAHRVEWSGTRDDGVAAYRVYRRCSSGDWIEVGLVKVRDEDERNQATYRFEERLDAECDYTVAAVGRNGVTGPMSVDIQ